MVASVRGFVRVREFGTTRRMLAEKDRDDELQRLYAIVRAARMGYRLLNRVDRVLSRTRLRPRRKLRIADRLLEQVQKLFDVIEMEHSVLQRSVHIEAFSVRIDAFLDRCDAIENACHVRKPRYKSRRKAAGSPAA